METKRVSFVVLFLLIGVVVMLGAGKVKEVDAKFCPDICYDIASYMTCPSTGDQHLSPLCNCCLAPPGCHLYLANGDIIC